MFLLYLGIFLTLEYCLNVLEWLLLSSLFWSLIGDCLLLRVERSLLVADWLLRGADCSFLGAGYLLLDVVHLLLGVG